MASRNLDYIINLIDGNFSRGMGKAKNQTSALDGMFKKLGGTIAASLSVYQAAAFVKESTDAFAAIEALDTRMKVASRTNENYAKNKEFLTKTITDLKLPLMETTEGFSKFMGSVRGTDLEGQKARDTFYGVAVASKVMKLSGESTGRVFNSLGKMMSTGYVQADEFGGMLAEALPGAMEMGSRAMGMSMGQFRKEMEKGNINAAKFVTQFSDLLLKEYGIKIPDAINTTQSKIIEMENAILLATSGAGSSTSKLYLKWLELKLKLIEAVGWLIEKYEKYSTVINLVLSALAGALTVYAALSVATAILTAKTWLLNAALYANPYVLLAMAIAAVIAGIIYCYNRFEWFKTMIDNIANSISTLIETIQNFFTLEAKVEFNPKEISDNYHKMMGGVQDKFRANMALNVIKKAEDDKKKKDNNNVNSTVSAGRSVRNVSVTIENLVREINIHTTQMKEGALDIKKQVQDTLIRAVLDSEAAL